MLYIRHEAQVIQYGFSPSGSIVLLCCMHIFWYGTNQRLNSRISFTFYFFIKLFYYILQACIRLYTPILTPVYKFHV